MAHLRTACCSPPSHEELSPLAGWQPHTVQHPKGCWVYGHRPCPGPLYLRSPGSSTLGRSRFWIRQCLNIPMEHDQVSEKVMDIINLASLLEFFIHPCPQEVFLYLPVQRRIWESAFLPHISSYSPSLIILIRHQSPFFLKYLLVNKAAALTHFSCDGQNSK